MFLNTFECVFEELYGNVKHKYEILPEYTHNVSCLFFLVQHIVQWMESKQQESRSYSTIIQSKLNHCQPTQCG